MQLDSRILNENKPPDTEKPAPRLQSSADVIEILDPITGEVIDTDDTDALIDCFERLKNRIAELYNTHNLVLDRFKKRIGPLQDQDKRTHRILGKTRVAKLEFPPDTWNGSILKEAWNSFPKHRDQLLRIDSIGVKAREFKKFQEAKGEKDWETFRDMIARAKRPGTRNPKVTIEK